MYLSILWNSFAANIIFSLRSEQFLYAMAAFGGYALTGAFIMSVLGGTLGQSAHYLFGAYLVMMAEKYDWWLKEAQYLKVQSLMRRYGIWLLVVYPIPYYPLLPMLAGFFRMPPGAVLLLIALGQIAQKLLGIYSVMHAVS